MGVGRYATPVQRRRARFLLNFLRAVSCAFAAVTAVRLTFNAVGLEAISPGKVAAFAGVFAGCLAMGAVASFFLRRW